MGNVSGQDSNSLLSKRLKKVTSDRQAAAKKQDQSSPVVAKIERVLFAYRETLAYYQDMLEQIEVEFKNLAEKNSSESVFVTDDGRLQKLTEYLTTCITELEQKAKSLEIVSTNQISAFKDASSQQLIAFQQASEAQITALEDLVKQAKTIWEPQNSEATLELASTSIPKKEMEEQSEEKDSFTEMEDMEAYNKNLTEIRKRLDDLMKFVGKVDGSIIEALKDHGDRNYEVLMEEIEDLKELLKRRSKGVKPLLIFNLIFGILSTGGIVVLLLEYLGILHF